MRASKTWISLMLVVFVMTAACTNNSVDDADSPNSVLEVVTLDNPAITGQITAGTCSLDTSRVCVTGLDCAGDPGLGVPAGGVCLIDPTGEGCQVEEWSASLGNVPKTELGTTSPFNDIALQSVTVSYTWDVPFANGPVTFPLAGTIPPGSTISTTFFPITNADLSALGATLPLPIAVTGFLTMTFRGTMVDGSPVVVTAGEQLFVEACF